MLFVPRRSAPEAPRGLLAHPEPHSAQMGGSRPQTRPHQTEKGHRKAARDAGPWPQSRFSDKDHSYVSM